MSASHTVVEEVPAALAGERIDRVVALVADVSRRQAVELIGAGAVLLDGAPPEKPSSRVEAGSSVSIDVPPQPTGPQADPAVRFDVRHVDDEVIVVDKPAGLTVHPGSGVTGGTLANGLLARFPELAGVGQAERPGVVHRLDRGTSGLLMVARTAGAYESLVAQLAARTVSRVYQVLVAGTVAADSGLVDAPLGRSPRDPTLRAVVGDGKAARTRYEVVERFGEPACTLLRCRLETGRTHQIRAHLTAIEHPVVGDERYGGPAWPGLSRPFLHAAHLGFDHPGTGQRLTFDAALPADLAAVLAELRSPAG